MYFYIFDIKKCKKRSQVEDIKNYLLSLGISGEYTYPSAIQSVSDLVDIGLAKQYNTIVGIGDDEIANEIANKLVGRNEAMGLVPISASSDLEVLIGAKTWKEGCENLRFRKIKEMKIGRTANNTAFLTNVFLDMKSPLEVTLEFKDFIIQTKATNLHVSNFTPTIMKKSEDHLDITITSITNDNSLLHSIGSFLGISSESKGFSLLRARSLRIFTKYQIPIVNNLTTIAKTPQLLEVTDDSVRIITAKKGQNFWS